MSDYNSSVFANNISSLGLKVGNSENNDISSSTRKVVETVCFAGLTSLACLVGIPANAINCLVFWRQGLRDRMNLCLFTLALTDVLHLTCAFAAFSVGSYVTLYDPALGEEYFLKSLVYLIGSTYGLRLTSGCISVIIAVERCLCVAFPLHAATLMRTCVMACLLCLSFLLLQFLYLVLVFSRRPVFVKRDGIFQWILVTTEFYEANKTIIQFLTNILLGAVVPITTFSAVSVATAITIFKLKDSMAWREKSSFGKEDNHVRQMALTSMLIAVSFVYIITMLPFVAWQTVRVVLQDMFSPNRLYNVNMAVNAVVQSCPLINSSAHFFVYYRRSSRFRENFHNIFLQQKVVRNK